MHTQGTPAEEVGGKKEKVGEEKGQQKASSVRM